MKLAWPASSWDPPATTANTGVIGMENHTQFVVVVLFLFCMDPGDLSLDPDTQQIFLLTGPSPQPTLSNKRLDNPGTLVPTGNPEASA